MANKRVYTANDRVHFGQYKDRLVKDVLKINPKYLKWAWAEKRMFDVDQYVYDILKNVQSDIAGIKLPPPVKNNKLEQIINQVVKEIRLERGVPTLTVDDFFEDIMDDDAYADLEGPAMEMAIDDLISEVQQSINKIPENNREVARKAIKLLWIEKILMWNKDTI